METTEECRGAKRTIGCFLIFINASLWKKRFNSIYFTASMREVLYQNTQFHFPLWKPCKFPRIILDDSLTFPFPQLLFSFVSLHKCSENESEGPRSAALRCSSGLNTNTVHSLTETNSRVTLTLDRTQTSGKTRGGVHLYFYLHWFWLSIAPYFRGRSDNNSHMALGCFIETDLIRGGINTSCLFAPNQFNRAYSETWTPRCSRCGQCLRLLSVLRQSRFLSQFMGTICWNWSRKWDGFKLSHYCYFNRWNICSA